MYQSSSTMNHERLVITSALRELSRPPKKHKAKPKTVKKKGKSKQSGGSKCVDISGKAATAKVYTTCCEERTPRMLCSRLKESDTRSVILYSTDNDTYQVKVKDIYPLIARDRDHVAKEFTNKAFSSRRANFLKEYANFLAVQRIYANNPEYTALPKLVYQDHPLFGMEILGPGALSRNTYIVFNEKGTSTIERSPITSANIREFIRDIYNSFLILHDREHIHNDVKLENMMYFPEAPHYRLIDWGKLYQAHTYDPAHDYYGTRHTGSPVSFYFSKLTKYVPGDRDYLAIRYLAFANYREYKTLSQDPEFLSRYNAMMDRFRRYFQEHQDEDIFQTWRYNIDLFGFGMSVIYLAHIRGIRDPAILDFGYRLMEAKNIRDVPMP